MKTNLSVTSLLVGLIGLLGLGTVEAQAVLFPTNPAPQVQLAWNAVAGASTYSAYYGVTSGNYTNKITGINGTNVTITLPSRGVKFFFAVTDTESHGLESTFSNEVNYTAPSPLGPPTQQPITVLQVQWSPTPTGVFADAPMNWSLTADQSQQYFKLRMQKLAVVVASASPSLERVNFKPTPPPMPGK